MFKLPYNGAHFIWAQGNAQKSFKLGFSSTWPENFQVCKLGLEKSEEPEFKLPTFLGRESNENSEKHLLLLYWLR